MLTTTAPRLSAHLSNALVVIAGSADCGNPKVQPPNLGALPALGVLGGGLGVRRRRPGDQACMVRVGTNTAAAVIGVARQAEDRASARRTGARA
jgi:hypothetical protein